MAYSDRIELYSRIEKLRKRPLLTYVTSLRQNASGAMGADVIPEFIHQVLSIPAEQKDVDVLIVSNGGDPIVPWRIVEMLRDRFDTVEVLLPYVAYSAATLLALGADKVVMGPFSNLGPVDPQLIYRRRLPGKEGQPEAVETINFGSEDVNKFFEFVKSDVGVSDQEQLERAFELLCNDVGSIPIGVAKRSSQLAVSLGEQLLSLHMKDSNQAKTIAEKLNRSFYHHNYTLGRNQAEEIGLPVERPEAELEGLIWAVWDAIQQEMQCSTPYDPLQLVLSNPKAGALVGPVNQVQIPANLPPPVLQQVIQQVLQQVQIVQVEPVAFDLYIATLESTRCRSEYRIKGRITAVRLPDMNISMNVVKTAEGWMFSETK